MSSDSTAGYRLIAADPVASAAGPLGQDAGGRQGGDAAVVAVGFVVCGNPTTVTTLTMGQSGTTSGSGIAKFDAGRQRPRSLTYSIAVELLS